ncbi:hypothetical protein ACT7DM_17075 [Bacillus cereus]
MCTYWENAVKEFFKKQEQERNKRAASKKLTARVMEYGSKWVVYSINGILSFIQGVTNYVGYMRSPINIQAAPIRTKVSNVIQNFLFSGF